jgi:hypothetical protein
VRRLDYARHGLRFDGLHEMEIAVPMTRDSYLAYVLSESGVETAIQSGVPEEEIRDWCRKTLRGGLDDAPRDVLFDAYAAYVRPAPRA